MEAVFFLGRWVVFVALSYSLICIIHPFWKIKTRKQATVSAFALFAIMSVMGAFLQDLGPPSKEQSSTLQQQETGESEQAEQQAKVEPDVEIADSEKGEKESSETTRTFDINRVREAQKQEKKQTTKKRRVYVEEDLFFVSVDEPIKAGDEEAKFKSQIVKIVNRIVSENDKCLELSGGATVFKDSERSKPNDPVFFVMCESSTVPFNVWFRPGDAKDGDFKAKEPIARGSAADACEAYAKSVASHPTTVEFSRFLHMVYRTWPDGRARVVSSFTAKNSFNLKLKYKIICRFDGTTLVEATVSEAR